MKQQTNESPGYMACCKVAVPLRIPRVGGKVLPGGKLVRAKVCVDFAGTLKDGTGRMLVVDFKRNDGKRGFPLSLLPDHQRDELIEHGRAGAVAGLLIEATANGAVYWFDWETIADAITARERTLLWTWAGPRLGPSNVVADLRFLTERKD